MKIISILFISVFISITLFSERVEIPENTHKPLFGNRYINLETTEIQFSLDGYETENISESGMDFRKISYWNEGEFLEIGKPNLPRFTRLIALPNHGKVSVEVINFEEEVLSNIIIYPCQLLQSESKQNSSEFTIDERYYSEGDIFPSKLVEVSNPAIMRDLRVANVTVNPFQYNPQTNELKIFKNVEFVVKCEGSGGVNIKTTNRTQSKNFESTYRSLIVNYDLKSFREDEFHQPNYLFIYPDDPVVETNLQYLIDWKHQKGFHVVAANTSQTGTTLNSIKNYIQNAYDTWENPPEFICLIGDAGGNFSIPTGHIDGGEGDHYYVLLEGNDILADAFIGRLSFNSISEFQTIIQKILNYEKEPFLENTNWYNNVLLVGDPTDSGQSCVNTKIYIKEMINQHTVNFSFDEIYSAPWVSQMINSLNEGVSYLNYRGFYGMSGWCNNQTNALCNGLMLPVTVILTCSVGDFEGTTDCRTERFLKAGSPGNPNGAIAAIGTATNDTNTCFNNCVDAGIFYGIFVDKIFHLGGALNRGKLNLYNCYPNNPYNAVYKFSYWNNLMGDPGMEIWTGVPQQMLISYNPQVPVGSNLLEVMALTSTGIPIENAWVTVLKGNDEIFSTGYTDNEGKIFLPICPSNTGEVNLTATKHNYIPHLGTFNIVQNDVFINVFEIEIDDDNFGSSSGNGDNIINPGEEIELNVSLKNFGSVTANSITASITSDNNFITITDNNEYYGDIPAGASIFSLDDFDFTVYSNVVGCSEFIIDILIQDNNNNEWNDKIYLNIEGPNLQPISYSIIDGNNSVLDPGETAELTVTIENVGTVSSNEVFGILTSSNNEIIIDDPNGYFGNIPPGSQMTNNSDRFVISADQEIIPGTQFALELQLYNASGYDNIISFILEVGEVLITDPLGPDSFGYYCYDDGDIGYDFAPVYDWIEIDPNYGGSGTVITLYDYGDMGDIENIDLPFVLRFYGKNYTTITVCSNGWIAPGSTDQMSFMNWTIPGPLGPSPIIAPFWDDLKMGSGNVCYFYDQTQNYFIIEWSHLQNDYDNSEETFQVILFDSNYYPTTIGSSEIIFQYKVINNTNQGNYGAYSNHGEFCTVGLEDYTGTIGLEYTYSNQYPTAAKILENEMALRFSGFPIPQNEPFLIFDSFEINDSQGNNNGIVNPGETIEMSITLKNIGADTAVNTCASLSSSDPFITITDSVQSFGNINPLATGTSLEEYTFDVATTCPDQYDIIFDLKITADGDYEWSSSFAVEVLTPDISTSTDTLDFEDIYPGYPDSLTLTVYNIGSDVLNITNIYTDNPDFYTDLTSFNLQSYGESQDVIVTVNTSQTGMINGTLYIVSNDPIDPLVTIDLLGEVLLPPEISVSPDLFNINLAVGDTLSEILTIFNNGGSDLEFDVTNTDNYGAGMAANFDGIDDYINFSENIITTTSFSIEAWINMNGQGGGSDNYNSIFEQRDDTPSDNHSTIVFHTEVYETARFFLRSSNGTSNIVDFPSSNYNEWNHYVSVVSPTMIYLYINGIPVDSVANTQQGNYITTIDYIDLGRHRFSGYTHGLYNGLMDEVKIWNYPRTHTEILSTMNKVLTGNESGLVAYWNFNNSNPWTDITGNGNDGIPYGGINTLESTASISSWLFPYSVSGLIPPDSSIDIEITFDSTVLEVGNYETEIIISSNDPDTPEIVVPVSLNVLSTGIIDNIYPLIPKLEGNYPNPFNPETTIKYQVSENHMVKILIYNIKGQLVKTLVNEIKENGYHTAVWDGSDENNKLVSSGIYLYKLHVGKATFIKKMLLLK